MSGLTTRAINYLPQNRIQRASYRIPENLSPECDKCEPPKNPFSEVNPGNPSSWELAYTKLISASEKWLACLTERMFNSYADPNSTEDPNMLRQLMFQARALIGLARTGEPTAKDQEEENKKALKELASLAKAA